MNTLRIVLLGKTGAGKSSCGNTILDVNSFLAKNLPNSVTRKCESKKKSIRGKEIMVVDTPGVFDTDLSEEDLKTEILRCITECAPGPHAFVIVLKVDRYTEEEKETVRKITASFGEEALKHTVVLFTRGDQLSEDQTIEDFVQKSAELKKLVDKCGGRVHVIDNRYWIQQQEGYRSNRVQLENLLNTIEKMVRENGGKYYSNEMTQMVNMTKPTTFKELCVRLAGVGTGVLLGAFLGAAGALTAVLAIKKQFSFMKITPPVMLGVVGASAVAGGVMGGGIGYTAAEGAETVTEAGTRTAEKIKETVTNVVENAITAFNKHKSIKMN